MRAQYLGAGLLLLVVSAGLTTTPLPAQASPPKTPVELQSTGLTSPGVPMAEVPGGVYSLRLVAEVDDKGEGGGTLELEPNAPVFNEFGAYAHAEHVPQVKLECRLQFVKKGIAQERRNGGPGTSEPVEWRLYQITGPKITSRLFLATRTEDKWIEARIIVGGPEPKARYVFHAWKPGPPEPCHPGCFPAGTSVRVPGGVTTIERIRVGDPISTVGPGGKFAEGKVAAIFVTRNRLLEVRTESGNLVTTETQPLALAGGELRAAGELKAGDRICRWENGARRMVAVQSVSPTGRLEPVFNLVLGEPTLFIAGDFLVRSKPPAPAATAEGEGVVR